MNIANHEWIVAWFIGFVVGWSLRRMWTKK